jgi:hypothetical protein
MPSGRGADQQRIRPFARPVREAALAELVLDQPVRRGVIRHAQQAFGQHHQGQPFRRGKRVFAQQRLDPADAAGAGADGTDQAARFGIDSRLARRSQGGARQELRGERTVIGGVVRPEGGWDLDQATSPSAAPLRRHPTSSRSLRQGSGDCPRPG